MEDMCSMTSAMGEETLQRHKAFTSSPTSGKALLYEFGIHYSSATYQRVNGGSDLMRLRHKGHERMEAGSVSTLCISCMICVVLILLYRSMLSGDFHSCLQISKDYTSRAELWASSLLFVLSRTSSIPAMCIGSSFDGKAQVVL